MEIVDEQKVEDIFFEDLSRIQQYYVEAILSHQVINQEVMEQCYESATGRPADDDTYYEETIDNDKVKKFIKQERQRILQEVQRDLIVETVFTRDMAATQLAEAYRIARNQRNPQVMIQATKTQVDLFGLNKTKNDTAADYFAQMIDHITDNNQAKQITLIHDD